METETVPGPFDKVVAFAEERARDRVRVLRAKYPGKTRKELAERLVTSFSRRAGVGGAVTGALAMVSLGAGLPAGVALTLAIEAELLLSLMELYGHDTAGEAGRLRLYALWAGSGLADAAKSIGLKAGADLVARAVMGSLPARIIARLNPVLVRLILKRLGMGWIPKALKLWPIVGAPIGYVLDSTAMKALGTATIATLESVATAKVTIVDDEEDAAPEPPRRPFRRRGDGGRR